LRPEYAVLNRLIPSPLSPPDFKNKSFIMIYMKLNPKRTAICLGAAALLLPLYASGQQTDSVQIPRTTFNQISHKLDNTNTKNPDNSWWSKVRATGSIQSEFLIPEEDQAIETGPKEHDVLNNTFFDLTVNAPYISIGGRFQFTKWPLPGYEKDFAGWGVPYLWATGSYKWAKLTVGDFYQQFGSGLILRAYEERSLGVDNAIRGGRLQLNPARGVYITALGGKQRRYWEHNSAWLWGGDVEWSLNDSFSKAFAPTTGLALGFSYVGKHEKDEVILTDNLEQRLRFPRNVAAFDARVKLRLHDFNFLLEGALRSQDPSADNGYTYNHGNTILLSAAYSRSGFSAFLQAKRSDRMGYFRSSRSIIGMSSKINYMPAFTLTQTYTLATTYQYDSQKDGEWAFQGEVRYKFKRNTPIGGRYGTDVRLSASYISGLDRNVPTGMDPNIPPKGSEGYGAAFWKIGKLYYSDLNFEINKKFNKHLQFTLFYLFQKYNQHQIEGHGVNGDMVTANTFILEGQWKINTKTQLRWELQYLTTKQDLGDWMAALVEFSLAPHWMITLSDTYNVGVTNLNYYNAMVTYNYKANRFTLGYGRTRSGYNCSGGVCRFVPASKGFSITYNYTF